MDFVKLMPAALTFTLLSLGLFYTPGSLAIHFYRSPQSLFPSGEMSLSKLQKNAKSTEFVFDFLVEGNLRKQWLSASKVAKDLDLSERVLYQEQEYCLKEVHGYWTLIERLSDGKRDWAPVTELVSAPEDQGKALTLISTSLRSGPSWGSALTLQLPAKTPLRILEIQDSWLKVEFESISGYVDLNNVLMKADFAKEVMDLKGAWHSVKYREGFQIVLTSNKTLRLSEISQWRTDPDRAIVTETMEDKKLLLRQNLKIEKTQAQVWTASQISGHGKVFWRRADAHLRAPSGIVISHEDFLKREIFSVSFSTKDPQLGIASSHGIFITQDGGLTWSHLPQFKNENYPVTISPSGHLFVGFMKSRDRGKTFSQYLRTDFLARLIQSQSKNAPRILRLSEIGFHNSRMQIKVDTGVKTLLMATRSNEDLITDWDVLN